MSTPETVGVVGAGAWGTALAAVARRCGRRVLILARRPELARRIAESGRNPDYLDGVALPAGLEAATGAADLAEAGLVVAAVPAQHLRAALAPLSPLPPRPLVIAAKGVEGGTGLLMTELAAEVLPGWPLLVLSGPTLAHEVARGQPTAAAVAGSDPALVQLVMASLGDRAFRLYANPDPVGVEAAGALKNVIAIAAGIVIGRGIGENGRAALIARGLAEIGRLAAALGGRPETLLGLAGVGDLMLTCAAETSRNFSLGRRLGEGEGLQAILASRRAVTEGVATAPAVLTRATALGVDLPVTAAVAEILAGAAIDATIERLLARPLRGE